MVDDVVLSELPASPQLRAVLERALRREPAERYSTPGEMREALQGVPEANDDPLAVAGSVAAAVRSGPAD
jgi:hypothetical protein